MTDKPFLRLTGKWIECAEPMIEWRDRRTYVGKNKLGVYWFEEIKNNTLRWTVYSVDRVEEKP